MCFAEFSHRSAKASRFVFRRLEFAPRPGDFPAGVFCNVPSDQAGQTKKKARECSREGPRWVITVEEHTNFMEGLGRVLVGRKFSIGSLAAGGVIRFWGSREPFGEESAARNDYLLDLFSKCPAPRLKRSASKKLVG